MNRTTRALGTALLTASLLPALIGCSATTVDENTLVIWDTGLLSRVNEDGSPDDEKSFLDTMIKEFEAEHDGVTVKLVQQSGSISENSAQFQAAAIAGDGPDIRVQYAGGPTISLAEFYTDLEPLLDNTVYDTMSGFTVNRENFDPNGRLIGMPYGAGNMFTVFANNEILRKAGLDPNKAPETWEELLANAKTITQTTDSFGMAVGNQEGYVGAWVITALVGGELGPDVFSEMYNGSIPADNPAMVKAYEAFADWQRSGVTNPDAAQLPANDASTLFFSGKAGYIIVGSWENNNMLERFGADGVSVYRIPVLAGAAHPKIGAGGPEIALSIAEASTHKELAAEFLNHLASVESHNTYVRLAQTQAANHKDFDRSALTNPLLLKELKDLDEATDGITFGYDSVMPQATIDLFYRLNSSAFNGTASPKDVVKQLSESLAQELAD